MDQAALTLRMPMDVQRELQELDRALLRYSEGRKRWPPEKRPKSWVSQVDRMLERRQFLTKIV